MKIDFRVYMLTVWTIILIVFFLIIFKLESISDPFTYDVNSNERLQFCYEESLCTTFIYLEQQVGCYQGCKFYTVQNHTFNGEQGYNYSLCVDACENLYQDKWREYK